MADSLVRKFDNDIYITHVESQKCFIKIWGYQYSDERLKLEKTLQDYLSISKEFDKLDLYGHTMYLYIWKTKFELKVYRCRVLYSNLAAKSHTILLLDYGPQIVVPYSDVREVPKDIDNSLINVLYQKSIVHTFFLSEYICKPNSNNYLTNSLCNKYYKYQKDFETGGMIFVTLFDTDKKLIENGLVEKINISTMTTIANSMFSFIVFHNTNDVINIDVNPKNTLVSCSFLRSQNLDYTTSIEVAVTRVDMDKNSILLTVRTLDNDSEAINDILNSLERQNLKLVPVVEVYTPCLVTLHDKLVRAIILEVKVDGLYIDAVDHGIREFIPRTDVFELPPKCNSIVMRSFNVILDTPKDMIVNKSIFYQKYFHMIPLKRDPYFGLYKVKLFKKNNDSLIDIFNNMSGHLIKPSKSSDLISITEIQNNQIENKTAELNGNGNQKETETENQIEKRLSNNCNNQNKKKYIELNGNVNQKETKTEIHVEKQLSNNYNNQIEKKIVKLNGNVNQKEREIEKQLSNNCIIPTLFLRKETCKVNQDIVGSLIYYKSPLCFRIRQYNPNFESFMDNIKTSLSSRHILTQRDLIKNMHVIYQSNTSDSVFRCQIIDMDSEVKKIKLHLVDDGSEIINEYFNKITLYNFIESDSHLPGQFVLDCALSNMRSSVINIDSISNKLHPYFNKKLLYKVLIIGTYKTGVKLVQLVQKDTNIDIYDAILKFEIEQRLCATMKTDNVDEMPTIQSEMEWKVVINRFDSFNKFYVQVVENKHCSASMNKLSTYVSDKSKNFMQGLTVGSIIETQTDKADGIWYKAEVMTPFDSTDLIVRILSDSSICKSTKIKGLPIENEKLCYQCFLEKDIRIDKLMNDPDKFDALSKFMMSNEWTMKTTSDREPFKVILTKNGKDCIDILSSQFKSPSTSFHKSSKNSNLFECIIEPENEKALLVESPKKNSTQIESIANNVNVPNIETVTIKYTETYNCFYTKSETLFTLYMERINNELDMSIVQLHVDSDIVGSIVVTHSKSMNCWCRVQVHEINPDGEVSCYLLDYGIFEICKEFYKPTDFLKVCPPIVRCCSLYAPKLAGKENEIWFPNINDMFKDIVSIKDCKLNMIIKKYGVFKNPCEVILKSDNFDISEMLIPINIQVTEIKSLTDFVIMGISNDQKTVSKLLRSNKVPTVTIENPTVNNLYLAKFNNKLKRVKLSGTDGVKYVVIDIDDTLNFLSVENVYEIPESIRNIPPFTLSCSLILKDSQEMYSLSMFQQLAMEKVTFSMCIITETEVKKPNLVKLYLHNKDVLDILKMKKK